MKILIVEDEPQMLENMTQTLSLDGYVVEGVMDYVSAIEKIGLYNYDCILLDIGLPDGNGFDLLRKLKELKKDDGVIIVSAKDSLDDRLQGLNLGADDYLPKPFFNAELNARVKAILRRRNFEGHDTIQLGDLKITVEERKVQIAKVAVELNRKEYAILLYLVTNKNRLVTKTALAEHVWGDNIDQADSFDFIYSQIKNLRKKIESSNVKINAIYGVGYKLETV